MDAKSATAAELRHLRTKYGTVAADLTALLARYAVPVRDDVFIALLVVIKDGREGRRFQPAIPIRWLRAALRHVQYIRRRGHPVTKRLQALRQTLDDLRVVAALQLALLRGAGKASGLSRPLRTGKLTRADLGRIELALRLLLADRPGRPGRLATPARRVVRAGCIAWTDAGRRESFTWDNYTDSIRGPKPDFIRELLALCGLTITDTNLQKLLSQCSAEVNPTPRAIGKNPR